MWAGGSFASNVSTSWVVAGLFLVPTIFYLLLRSRFSFWAKKNINGPQPTLLIGNSNELMNPCQIFTHQRWVKEYGKLYGFWDMMVPKLAVADHDLIKRMLVQDFASITDRRIEGFDHHFERQMAIFQEGDDWKKSRALMTPAFSTAKFKQIFEEMNVCCNKQLQYMDRLVSSGKSKDIDAFQLGARYFSDIISQSFFSVSFLENYEQEDKIERALFQWFTPSKFKLFLSGILPGWFKTSISFSVFDTNGLKYPVSLFRHLIKERGKVKDQSQDLLKLMIENGKTINWTEDTIVANLILMYVAGYVSSAYLFSFTLYHMIKFPHIVDNIIAELDELEANGESLTPETIQKRFVYLDAVISETQRLYPTTTYTERKVSAKEYTFEYKGDKYTIPRDTIIFIPIYAVHRDPEYFDEPDKFDETRFLPERKASLNQYAFLPFGHGPRNCIGTRFALVSTKLLLLSIIKRYKFSFVDEKVDPMADLTGTVDEMLIPLPIRVRFDKL